ncbi:hypothetical protein E2C01_061982 [Portunus trituberculatus]|uniref:Uncharacterized protein n=1 Tax=Portunus trituberculatus TaxID=210409 RepID=A0A5B7HFU5_PORTR|nr:hypothetical protein [Portunus trituberculatus]
MNRLVANKIENRYEKIKKMGFGVSKCICAEVGSDKEALDGGEQKRSKFGFSPHKKHHTPSMSKVERGGCLLTILPPSLSHSLSLSHLLFHVFVIYVFYT